MRKIPLWQWGLFCFLGAGFGQVASSAMGPPADRAEAAGRGVATLLFVIIGIVLIVLHFVWPKRGDKRQRKTAPRVEAPKGPAGLPPRRPGGKRP